MLHPISFRVVRFMVKEGLYETVITNLPADHFPPSLLRMLYNKRWGIETDFRDLKYIIALTHFYAKKHPFIMQEILARMTLYNFCVPASLACQFYAAERQISLPCERCFCRPQCTGVPAWFCVCGKIRIAHCKFSASCPVRPTKTGKYACEAPGQFSVQGNLILLFIRFSRRRLRGFAMPFFQIYVLVKSFRAFSLRDGFIGRIILMRLRRSWGIFMGILKTTRRGIFICI